MRRSVFRCVYLYLCVRTCSIFHLRWKRRFYTTNKKTPARPAVQHVNVNFIKNSDVVLSGRGNSRLFIFRTTLESFAFYQQFVCGACPPSFMLHESGVIIRLTSNITRCDYFKHTPHIYRFDGRKHSMIDITPIAFLTWHQKCQTICSWTYFDLLQRLYYY